MAPGGYQSGDNVTFSGTSGFFTITRSDTNCIVVDDPFDRDSYRNEVLGRTWRPDLQMMCTDREYYFLKEWARLNSQVPPEMVLGEAREPLGRWEVWKPPNRPSQGQLYANKRKGWLH